MTKKTDNLEASEAFKLLQEGHLVVKDAHVAEWYPEDLRDKSDLRLDQSVSRAPFRLAKVEPQSVKERDPYEHLEHTLNVLTDEKKISHVEDVVIAITSLIRSEIFEWIDIETETEIDRLKEIIADESRKIAQEEIAKSKHIPDVMETLRQDMNRELKQISKLNKVLAGQDRGEPNE